MAELCERYGVDRFTGYKRMARWRASRRTSLIDPSRAPHICPQRTDAELAALIVAARQEYGWGAKKLRHVLRTRYPARPWPARSTFNAILNRHALLHKNRHRRKWTHPGTAPLHTDRSNQVWPVDFKGQLRPGDGSYCYPLTVTDHFSRSFVACHGLRSVAAGTNPLFCGLFRTVGLAEAILSLVLLCHVRISTSLSFSIHLR